MLTVSTAGTVGNLIAGRILSFTSQLGCFVLSEHYSLNSPTLKKDIYLTYRFRRDEQNRRDEIKIEARLNIHSNQMNS